MPVYRGFPGRLSHEIPDWVETGAWFHIRIALERSSKQPALTDESIGPLLLTSASHYEESHRWYIGIFLLMPDHVHAVLSFSRDGRMSEIVRTWKRFHARNRQLRWEDNYFDHRIRDDERGEQLAAKIDYIRQNPVVAGLCDEADDWRWKLDWKSEGPEVRSKSNVRPPLADTTGSA
jgi:REP element-mobilizing transposase RayT